MSDNILIRCDRFLLTFYPADFREQHGDEMDHDEERGYDKLQ